MGQQQATTILTSIAEEDTISKTLANLNTKCLAERRTPEGNLHQQVDHSPPTQRKQQDQHQERSTTCIYSLVQAVYGNTRKHVPTTD